MSVSCWIIWGCSAGGYTVRMEKVLDFLRHEGSSPVSVNIGWIAKQTEEVFETLNYSGGRNVSTGICKRKTGILIDDGEKIEVS